MQYVLLIEQTLNGIQLGMMLFLMAAGLTLVFGIMNFVNLAHGSFFMLGAFFAASFIVSTGSVLLGILFATLATAIAAAVLEFGLLRFMYERSHLDQVMVTIGLIFVFNELTRMIWGVVPLSLPIPEALSGSVRILPGVVYPTYRLAILGAGLVLAILLYVAIVHTRGGMWVRAGASDRPMASALGVDVQLVFAVVFAIGAALAGLAGVMTGPIIAVQIGMGEPILILAMVVMVIGGIGSIRGAFIAALLVGLVDTFGRVLLPPALGSMVIFIFMAGILAWKPAGLFPSHG
jgi:branched-chain amino acid transport system permease protein